MAPLIPVILIGLAGAVARFWQLGAKSFWLDEAVTYDVAARPLAALIRTAAGYDAHPPLFSVLAHPFILLVGNETGLRFLPALCSLLLMVAVYAAARRAEKDPARPQNSPPSPFVFWTVLLCSLSAFQVFFAQEGRLYTLFGLLALALFLLVQRFLEPENRKDGKLLAAAAAVSAAGIYTHLYFFFVIAASVVAVAAAADAPRKKRRWALSQAAALVLFVPWIPALVARAGLATPAGPVTGFSLFFAFNQLSIGYTVVDLPTVLLSSFFCVLPVAAVIAALFAGRSSRLSALLAPPPETEQRQFLLPLAIFLLLPLCAVVLMPLRVQEFEAKHLFFLSPFFLLLSAYGLGRIKKQAAAVFIGAGILFFNVFSLATYFSPEFRKENWRQAAAYVKTRAQTGDALIFSPDYAAFPFVRYEGSGIPVITGGPAGLDLGPAVAAGTRRIWLVENFSPVAEPDARIAALLSSRGAAGETILFTGALGMIQIRPYTLSPRKREAVEGRRLMEKPYPHTEIP